MAETFRCDHCGWEGEKAWTDEEALAEERENFGFNAGAEGTVGAGAQQAQICDDCYQEFIKWARAEGLTREPN